MHLVSQVSLDLHTHRPGHPKPQVSQEQQQVTTSEFLMLRTIRAAVARAHIIRRPWHGPEPASTEMLYQHPRAAVALSSRQAACQGSVPPFAASGEAVCSAELVPLLQSEIELQKITRLRKGQVVRDLQHRP